MNRFYSAIIPVYNRPEEVDELLDSLTKQTYRHFEVIIVEDGSKDKADKVADKYKDRLSIKYHFKENSGQGFSRNVGFELATGDFFVIFDSDAIIPPHYFQAVNDFLDANPDVALFGGPDAAHGSFTPMQKAISYSMTSFFTTGGIRGRKKHIGKFHPRSFNMGLSREAYEKAGGFKITRMGEDIEFSIRIINSGFRSALIPEAYIYHKRRTSLAQFYKQLHFFGRARINISRFYPEELKAVHWFPALFVMANVLWLMSWIIDIRLFCAGAAFWTVYYALIFFDALIKTKSIKISLLSIATSFVQLFAYGVGFLTELKRKILNK